MVNWSDIGIVLASHPHGEKYKIVNIFTKDHGRIHAMVSKSKNNTFSIFSNVEIGYSSKDAGSLGFWKLLSERQNWIFSMNSEKHLLVCQGICFLLNKILPQGVCHKRLFEFAEYISKNLHQFSAQDILLLYAYFEFSLLEDIGLSIDKSILQEIPRVNEFYELPSLLKTESIIRNAKNFLSIAGRVIEQNLLKIDNYYRSLIFRMI